MMMVMEEPHSLAPWDTRWVPLEYNAFKVCNVLGERRSEVETCNLRVCCSTRAAYGMCWLSFQYRSIHRAEKLAGDTCGTYEVLYRVVNWFVPTFRRNYLLPPSGQCPSRCQNKTITIHDVKTQKFCTGVTVFLYHPVST